MENFILTISLLLVGMALRRVPAVPEKTGNALILLVVYVALPAMILLRIPELVISAEVLVPALMPWVMLLFSAGLVLLLSKLLEWDRATTGCLLLLIPLGNTSFLGIPMVKAFFGDGGIPYALVYYQLGSFPALVIHGSIIVALYGSGDRRPTIKGTLRRLVTFPPSIAFVLALLLRFVSVPPAAVDLLTFLSAALVPLVMIAVGFQLNVRLGREAGSQLGLGLAIKLVVAPLTALLLCKVAGLEGEAARVSVFQAGMPPMVLAGAMAIADDLAPGLTAALVGIGIVVSFVTLPLLYQLII